MKMKKKVSYRKHQERKRNIAGIKVIGIDPAKEKHQVTVIDEQGIQMGNSFAITVSHKGFNEDLWKKLGKILGKFRKEEVVFAIESSCDIWRVFAGYLHNRGYAVLLVSPLITYKTRSTINNDFSKTDPKDAYLVAENAQGGKYNEYMSYTPEINKLHSLCIAHDKLTKDRNRIILRLRALMEEIFPEYLKCVHVEIKTSLYLLGKYFLPEHFQKLDVDEEEWNIRRISNGKHNADTLKKIKEHARNSIGARKTGEEDGVRITLDAWISQLRLINENMKTIGSKMIELAKETEFFEILVSVPGISDISATRLIGECRDLNLFDHYKQIEKMAGSNIRVSDSGKSAGMRRLNKLGNKRLLKLIYIMTTQAARFMPEVRIKFLKRQIKKKSYRKNIFAASSILMRILMVLIKEKRTYELREDKVQEMERLELKYNPEKKDKKKGRKRNKKKTIKKAA
ncbi:transposase IS116/IS110/IS902 family protein [bacterium BMS3Abin06]|nr:transposase IS116/IS110/IS902 family protein [bacterium BMS3Abin06]